MANVSGGRWAARFAAAAAPLLPRGARVVVACSGGADSVALLRLVVATRRLLGLRHVAVAHLDHALRPGSADDAAFVARLAARLNLPAVVERRAVRRRRGESPEEAARRVRYRFLADAARRLGCDVVATAHHIDDQAETVLYRAIRGAGLAGLRGILPETEIEGARVVRPLLGLRRAELRRFLAARGQAWREDPTNGPSGGSANDRARLRNEILPAIRAVLGRDPAPPLARLASNAQREFRRAPGTGDDPTLRRPPGPASIPVGRAPTPSPPPVTITWDVRPAGNAAFLDRIRARPGALELLDADRIAGTLVVRTPRPGDRFHAAGLPKAQRLGHYLQRRGVAAAERADVPLLCDDEGIVCVGGQGIATRVAVTTGTRRLLVVRSVPAQPASR